MVGCLKRPLQSRLAGVNAEGSPSPPPSSSPGRTVSVGIRGGMCTPFLLIPRAALLVAAQPRKIRIRFVPTPSREDRALPRTCGSNERGLGTPASARLRFERRPRSHGSSSAVKSGHAPSSPLRDSLQAVGKVLIEAAAARSRSIPQISNLPSAFAADLVSRCSWHAGEGYCVEELSSLPLRSPVRPPSGQGAVHRSTVQRAVTAKSSRRRSSIRLGSWAPGLLGRLSPLPPFLRDPPPAPALVLVISSRAPQRLHRFQHKRKIDSTSKRVK